MVKLFLGGFPLDITEMKLVQLLGPYTDVITIKIVRDKKTRLCKGYAFLELPDQKKAEAAIEALNGSFIGDRMLSLALVAEEPAKPVVEKPAFEHPKAPKVNYIKTERPGDNTKKKRPRRTIL